MKRNACRSIATGFLMLLILAALVPIVAKFIPAPIEGRFMFKDFRGGAMSLGPDYSYRQFRNGKLIFYSSDGPPVVAGHYVKTARNTYTVHLTSWGQGARVIFRPHWTYYEEIEMQRNESEEAFHPYTNIFKRAFNIWKMKKLTVRGPVQEMTQSGSRD